MYGKKIESIIFVAIFLLMAVACRQQVPAHEKEARRVTMKVANELVEERDLSVGAFGGELMDEVEGVSFWFYSKELHDREQARELYVTIMSRFLDAMNGDAKLQPYLAEVPFPNERLDIKLSYRNSEGEPPPPEKVAFVTQAAGKIHYSAMLPDGKFVELGTAESYEEAVEAVLGGDTSR